MVALNQDFATPSAPSVQVPYYGFRYYDPVTGRWPSRDPIKEWAFTVNFSSSYDTRLNIIAAWFRGVTSTFIDNNPLDFMDILGLSKGGKQNISVNHNGTNYNKTSDPKAVRNAMNQAKQSGQSKAANKLKGLLKVIKRGGGMVVIPPMLLPPNPFPQAVPPVSPSCSLVDSCMMIWECTCPSGYTPFGQTQYKQKTAPNPTWKCHDSNFVS